MDFVLKIVLFISDGTLGAFESVGFEAGFVVSFLADEPSFSAFVGFEFLSLLDVALFEGLVFLIFFCFFPLLYSSATTD